MALIGLRNWSHVCYHCLLKGKKSNVLLVNVLHVRMLEILGEPFILFTALLLAALPPPMIPCYAGAVGIWPWVCSPPQVTRQRFRNANRGFGVSAAVYPRYLHFSAIILELGGLSIKGIEAEEGRA